MKSILYLLLAPSLVLAAKYDPSEERTALRQHATAAYTAAENAAGLPLEPAKAAMIKADLDDAVAEANLAASSAKSLETAGSFRAGEMESALKGKDDAAKNLGDAATALRSRWKKLTSDQKDLKEKVDALPDEKPAGKPNEDKSRLKGMLDQAATFLSNADGNLTIAENGAPAMSSAVDQMNSINHRSKSPAGERKSADDEALSSSDALPPPVAEAKAAVDLLGQEPQGVNRTHAGDKLGVPRELTRRLLAAADRACNRDGDFVSLSSAFERAKNAFEDARRAADGKPEAAKALLEQAEAAQADVRTRLARN